MIWLTVVAITVASATQAAWSALRRRVSAFRRPSGRARLSCAQALPVSSCSGSPMAKPFHKFTGPGRGGTVDPSPLTAAEPRAAALSPTVGAEPTRQGQIPDRV